MPAWLVGLLLALPSPARAVPDFTQEKGLQVTDALLGDVVKDGTSLRMYYVRGGTRVFSATSAQTDGLTWAEEGGVRLTTGTAEADLDRSSITSVAVLPVAGGWRLLYVGISTGGKNTVLSAFAAAGNASPFAKEAGARLQFNDGKDALASLSLAPTSTGVRLYYVRTVSPAAGSTGSSVRRVYSAHSVDEGVTWTDEGQRFGETAFAVSASSRTDGAVRMLLLQPLSDGTTGVTSALSGNGLSFAKEAGIRYSTNPLVGAIQSISLERSTESFRWRLYVSVLPLASLIPNVSSALTLDPQLASLSPRFVYRSDGTHSFQVLGEILSVPTPAVQLKQGTTTVSVAGLVRVDDQTLTFNRDFAAQPLGNYDLTVTNSGGRAAALGSILFVDFHAGFVNLLDNLFRPLLGQKVKLNVTLFHGGPLTIKIYNTLGQRMKTVTDAPVVVTGGTTTFNFDWDGRTELGNTVATGLYFVEFAGTKMHIRKKILVVK